MQTDRNNLYVLAVNLDLQKMLSGSVTGTTEVSDPTSMQPVNAMQLDMTEAVQVSYCTSCYQVPYTLVKCT